MAAVRAEASVLYAEDENLIGETLSDILREHGFDVHWVEDGLDALKAAELRHYDMLLTDLDMPRMGGGELIARLREQRPSLPVLILTGNPPQDSKSLLDTGMPGPTLMLSKPARLGDIIDKMQQILHAPATPLTPACAPVACAPVQTPQSGILRGEPKPGGIRLLGDKPATSLFSSLVGCQFGPRAWAF